MGKRRRLSGRGDFFRLLAESALDLVVVLDGEGKAIFVSPSVKRLLGYEREEILGRNIMDFIHPEDMRRSTSNLETALKRPGVTQYSLQRIRHKDGTWRYHEASALNLLGNERVRGLVINSRDVTERVNLEVELRHSRREMATLLSNLPGMAYRCRNDPQWTMLFLSEGCRELTGYAPEELRENAKVSYAELIHPEDRERVWKEVQQALERREPFRLLYRIRTASGERKWVWEQGRGIFSEDGGLQHLEGFITDITERVWVERVTRLQRDLAQAATSTYGFREYIEQAMDIIFQLGEIDRCAVYLLEGEREYRPVGHRGLSEAAASEAGFLCGSSALAETLKRGEAVQAEWAELCRQTGISPVGEPSAVALVPLRWDGKTVGCLFVGVPGKVLSPGTLEFVEAAAVQMAQAYGRHGLLDMIRESEARYRLLLEFAGEAIFSCDRYLRVTGINRKAIEMLGYSREELLGRNILELGVVHPADHERILKGIGSLLAGGGTHSDEIRFIRKDGQEILAEVTGASLLDKEGRVIEIVNVSRDVTERRHTEEALRRSEERYRVTFEATGTAMFHVNRRAVITDTNREAERLFGYTREEMVGRMRYMDLLMPEDVERVKGFSRKLLSGELSSPLQVEIMARHRSGRAIPALITVAMLPGLEESVISLLDISEKEEYERELERRAEEMRDFLDIAAHELRHPATLLKGYAVTLKEYWGRMDEEARTEALRAVDKGADRLVGVVEELLEAARVERKRMKLDLREVDPGELARRAVEEMRARFPEREMVVRLAPELGMLRADAERLLRLLVILIDNAVKYSPRETPVELDVEREEGAVRFTVLDRGRGVPEEDRERIFERFYQVEEVMHHAGPGLGLGLYIGRSIAEAHGGRIWYEPRPGGGSAFRFTIPLSRFDGTS